MANTQIHGARQIRDATITNDQIHASADIESTKLASWTANRDAGSNRLTNLDDPVDAQDAATKAWVEGEIGGLPTGPSGSHAIQGGRLSLTSGEPVETTDVTGAGTIYMVPVIGGGAQIGLWDGAEWQVIDFSEESLSLAGIAADTNYDVCAYLDAGNLALELSDAWTDDTTRSDPLVLLDGVPVLDSDPTRRILGSIRGTGSGTTENSTAKSFVANIDNLFDRSRWTRETTDSWTQAGNGTWAAINSGAAPWKMELLVALGPIEVHAETHLTTDVFHIAGIGLDGADPDRDLTHWSAHGGGSTANQTSYFRAVVGTGYHVLQGMETTGSVTTRAAYGDNGGTIGAGSLGVQSGMMARWSR